MISTETSACGLLCARRTAVPGGAIRECLWRANKSSQRAGRHDGGRTQIHLRIGIAHASFEIAIGGADRDFAFAHQTATQADACSATGRQRNGARIHQSFPITSGLGLGLHFGAGGGQIKFDTRGNASAAGAHHFRGVMQIFKARVHARQQIRLLNRHMFPLHFRQRHHGLHFVRPGHMRNHGRQIEFKFDGVVRVRVGAKLASILPPRIDVGVGVAGATLGAARSRAAGIGERADARAQIIHRHFIKWKHARQRAPLGRHVGDGHARAHGKMRHAIAHKFHGVIEHLVFVEESAQSDDDILAGDARRKDFPSAPPWPPLGTCHHVTPVAQILAASVRTTGVPSAATAPYKLECESLATTNAPGTT